MSIQIAVGVYLVVHVLSAYLLRASGVWQIVFGPSLDLLPDRTPDPLRVAPRGWIENHVFWDLTPDKPDTIDEDEDEEVIFWGSRRKVG